MRRGLLLLFVLVVVDAQAGSGPLLVARDRQHVERALEALVMTPADAGFEKNVGKPVWALSWITNTLTDPWQLPVMADHIREAADQGDEAALWSLIAEVMEVAPVADTGMSVIAQRPSFTCPPELDPVLENAISAFLTEAAEAASLLQEALRPVPEELRPYLAASVLCGVFETEDDERGRTLLSEIGISRTVQEQVEREARQLDTTDEGLAWIAQARVVDYAALLAAVHRLESAATRLKDEVAESALVWPVRVMEIRTDLGRVIIGTTGDDTFEAAALLILDPGGADVYRGASGFANGLADVPMAVVVDLAGDDRYVSQGALGIGAALWGLAVVLDRAGDDQVVSAGLGGGAALWGAAWYKDHSGNDSYQSHALAQGAAHAGFAVLCDQAGLDRYDVGFQGQGFAGVLGCGLLIDRTGHDRYFAGHVQLDHERNDERFLSLAQGFAIGMRPHAGGGVGALVDLAGNDVYTADIYAQGVSYYYAAGFLVDGAGHDRYAMHQYGQGCGIHLSLGLLADLAGDDVYAGFILAQGAAHDFAVGMLFDHEGNDTYTGDHHVQGRALNNAFALLLDREGVDGYFARQRMGGQGIGNEGGFRDYGSLALLLDLGGTDLYSGGFSNRTVTLRPLYGVVYDYEEQPGE